ncbi:hypothetical protein HPC49_28940 [Pyxidicoccus fallax]|uniref:Lipoprotein n=1 Tax=Pyxidicoccus fallax TaxID=394095 RepID=A0A848LHF3_9BACT|nr:hypothetical protein [Pyxidicoccus fallax]NMO16571.1 hypothetical protein [Pyxidicoccus fallax]NPC82231.1 hypothetical protein [Pyxidicoccus fallax]
MRMRWVIGSTLLLAGWLTGCGGGEVPGTEDTLGEIEQQVWYCNLDIPELSQCPEGYYCYQPSHECRRMALPAD